MHILLVADGRSPTTQRWIQGLLALQHRVSLVSSFPCEPLPGVEATHLMPVAFSGLAGSQVGTTIQSSQPPGRLRASVRRFRSAFLAGRYWFGPYSVWSYRKAFRRLVQAIQPDLVHSLRIPFEGMLASYTPPGVPLAISVWGNDLTLHAHGSPWMRKLTHQTLQRADGLLADATRDIRLANQMGLRPNLPTKVVPGSGGLDLVEIHQVRSVGDETLAENLPAGVPLIVNPRGFRPGSVRNDVFFQAIPLVLQRWPQARFVCLAMASQPEATGWVERLKLGPNVRLLPYLPQTQVWDLFLRAEITVSVSQHDGTPNTLLEAMACGCFPIVGDIESLREWITPGVNGLLVEPTKPQDVAEALLTALDHPELRTAAAEINHKLIRERAEVNLVRAQMQIFYEQVSGQHTKPV